MSKSNTLAIISHHWVYQYPLGADNLIHQLPSSVPAAQIYLIPMAIWLPLNRCTIGSDGSAIGVYGRTIGIQ